MIGLSGDVLSIPLEVCGLRYSGLPLEAHPSRFLVKNDQLG